MRQNADTLLLFAITRYLSVLSYSFFFHAISNKEFHYLLEVVWNNAASYIMACCKSDEVSALDAWKFVLKKQ